MRLGFEYDGDIVGFDEVVSELSKIDNLIVFAGAGVSVQTGAPTWKELLKSLIETSEGYLDKNFCLNLKDCLNEGSKDDPLIAQEIYDALKKIDKQDVYYDTIKNALDTEYSDYTAQHIEIVRTINTIITTNFDNGFEVAFEKLRLKTPVIEALPSLNELKLHEGNLIAHIHGKLDENYIIFKKDDYDKYYPSVTGKTGSDKLETYLKHVYRNYTLIFVGFSFEDRYIRKFFKMQKETLENNDKIDSEKPGFSPSCDKIKHYAFIKNINPQPEPYKYEEDSLKLKRESANFKRLMDELKNMNICPVLYQEHKDWMKYFEKLERIRSALEKVERPERAEFFKRGVFNEKGFL